MKNLNICIFTIGLMALTLGLHSQPAKSDCLCYESYTEIWDERINKTSIFSRKNKILLDSIHILLLERFNDSIEIYLDDKLIFSGIVISSPTTSFSKVAIPIERAAIRESSVLHVKLKNEKVNVYTLYSLNPKANYLLIRRFCSSYGDLDICRWSFEWQFPKPFFR